MSTIAASHSCVWLMMVGGKMGWGNFATRCVLLELSEWHSEITNKQTARDDKQVHKYK